MIFFQVIYLAGDSDVGGEGVDIYTQAKASRNEEYFGKITGIEKIYFVDFLKVESLSPYFAFIASYRFYTYV